MKTWFMLYAFSLVLVLSTFCSPILHFSTNLETATLNFHHDSECVCFCFKIVLILSRADSHPPHFSFDEIFLTSCILGIWKRANSKQLKFSTQNNFHIKIFQIFPFSEFSTHTIFQIFHTKQSTNFPFFQIFQNFPRKIIFHIKFSKFFRIFHNSNYFPNFPIFHTKKQNTNFPQKKNFPH